MLWSLTRILIKVDLGSDMCSICYSELVKVLLCKCGLLPRIISKVLIFEIYPMKKQIQCRLVFVVEVGLSFKMSFG